MKGFTIIYGCMFAGKTTTLLKKAIALNPEEYLVFKPDIDTRSKRNTIRTHNNDSLQCIDVAKPIEILSHITPKTSHVFLDEVQFMDSSIIQIITKLLNKNLKVSCAGLLYDTQTAYFGSMQILVAMASHKIELFAKCQNCSKPASITQYLGNLDSQINIGGEEKYRAFCTICIKGTT